MSADHSSHGNASEAPHLLRRFGLLEATALNMTNMVGIVLSASCERVDEIRITESVDCSTYESAGTQTAMGFSQEVVQEFQVSTVNFDLTTGLTNGAAINVTTRSGGNELHGSILTGGGDVHRKSGGLRQPFGKLVNES